MGELKVIDGTKRQKKSTVIAGASDVHKAMRFLEGLDRENFYILCLNAKNYITHKELITIGTLTSSLVHPREVFRPSIKNNSASIICVHNHPSGIPTPSREDIEFSIRLVNAGEIIGIKVLDHVIIGKNKYFSMAEKNIVGFNQQGKAGLIAQGGNEQPTQEAEELHGKLDYERNSVVTELLKMEALIKLGYVTALETDKPDDSISWVSVMNIFETLNKEAQEKAQTMEGLIYEFGKMYKKAPNGI